MKLQLVSANRGSTWVRQGLRTFMRQPLGLIGLFMMFALLLMGLHVLPTLGTALGLALVPGFTAGFVRAARRVEEGKFPLPHELVYWARSRVTRQRMAALGGLYLLSIALLMLVSVFVDGGSLARFYVLGGTLDEETLRNPALLNAALLTLVLYLPVSMAFWHAPMLVADEDIGPVKALFFSFVACKRNIGAFTVYGLSWSLFYMAISMLASAVAVMVGGPEALQWLLMPMTLAMAALFFTSIHYSYRDCLVPPEGELHDAT
ncbi:BPSS1780 family membrane protein [Curvibacter sp. APW13]|uniref:BPSS1780 family membrane protein n=1 Tax=Curvibacter sp. APW13 TaxID=3077236 RepID=UPI0028DD81D2|nr:BPSS1780 family membrane protein [Curvibacter sp. APW13]MDT8989353.1 BPSS1780 family membrane protein [Curvibacter sp. APW13]